METELEQILITHYKENMVAIIGANPELFDEAVKLALAGRQPFSWRAAWLLWECMKENDERIRPYVGDIIKELPLKEDGHRRELLKILLKMELDEEHEGVLFDISTDMWKNINSRPSTRLIAMKMIVKIVKKYPELYNEVSFLTQEHYLESLSPAVRKSLPKIMKEIIHYGV